VLLMERPEADFRVFNVGPGRATTVLDFARLVLRAAGSDLAPVISGQFRVGDTRHTVSDITALSALGWSAAIPLERTIKRYIEWIRPFQGTLGYLDAAEAAMRSQNVVRSARQ
jgi:dTDP-L-rhamnose 4-epimerase